ncbi:GLPGLI family protein [Cellulophaga sp. HaHaR_3_176]|uniref:GLPGLI family protein n=1 Tax=Cellulophaga sp. HaHaR_3_176 TaxID=1942464 RepID=UPI001C1FB7B9|nr:GLPGLI family protein [Cellulophaga sp. HaHaR_3_176]QWX84142.1 GLPGLI family protein [Cellulophaga sp. HaHaR_3_176]
MKKCILLIFAYLFVLGTGYSQDFQGKAYYQSKTSVGDMSFGRRDMSEEQKKRMMERMKKMFEKTFILTFDKSAAIYIEEERLDAPTNDNGRGPRFGGVTPGKLYKNIKDQSYTNGSEMFGKFFLIKDDLQKLDWKMGSETKKIGNYTCYKATAMKAVDSTDFAALRRKREKDRKKEEGNKEGEEGTNLLSVAEEPKEMEITAWFTPEIPVSQGPSDYWGLPGLILEVNAGDTAILCTKIVLNAEEKEEIKAPTKGKEVNQAEYNKIMLEKMEEMSERFRGGNRGSGGGQGRSRN